MFQEVAKWDDAKWNGMFNQPMDVAFDRDYFYVVQGHGGTAGPPDCTYCAAVDQKPSAAWPTLSVSGMLARWCESGTPAPEMRMCLLGAISES